VFNQHRALNYDPEKTSYTPCPLHNHILYKIQQDEIIKNYD